MIRPATACALLLLAAAAPPTREQLHDAERNKAAQLQLQQSAQARATAAQAEERRLASQRVIAADSLRQLETQSEAAANKVSDLARQREEAQAALARHAAEMAPFLPLIQRLALFPAETLLAAPMPTDDAVRGILVLGSLTRELEGEAAGLRAEQVRLDALGVELSQAIPDLAAKQAAQARMAADLDAQVEAAQALRHQAEGDASASAKRAAAEAARADTLRAAIARLDSERAAADAKLAADARQAASAKPSPDAKAHQEAAARPTGPFSTLVAPVAGSVVLNFGDQIEGGNSNGLTYQVPPSARVVAPCGGRVVFSGPFRSFGLLVILDCGTGWHVVLSGFEKLEAQLGQTVQSGEPIGAMAAWNPLALLRRPKLDLELRRDGQPVDPAPFLRSRG